MIIKIFRLLTISTALICMSCAEANEITLPHNGMILNASLELAQGKKLTDGIILITHGGLAHNRMELVVYLQSLLKDHGYNSLAINLSLGISNRHGMYDCSATHRHRNSDALEEIDVWVKWAKKQGIKNVVLLGHSRGGAQIGLYAAERDNAFVKAIVLMAPATRDNGAAGYEQRFNKPLAPFLQKSRDMIANGKGDYVMKHANMLFCRDAQVTADSFVSYYGQDDRVDTPLLLDKIAKPTHIIVAGNDEIVKGLGNKLASREIKPNIEVSVIEGSDHFFRDLNSDEAVENVIEFLRKNNIQ